MIPLRGRSLFTMTSLGGNWSGPLVDCLCFNPVVPDLDADAAAWRTSVVTASALGPGRSVLREWW
jgi:hypothetical protein